MQVFESIKSFIMEYKLIELIIPIGIPFTLFHLFMKIVRAFNKQIIVEDISIANENDEQKDKIEIPEIINQDIVLSNNQFIKLK